MSHPLIRLTHLFLAVVLICALPTAIADDPPADDDISANVVYGHKDGLAMTMDVYSPGAQANGAGILFMVSGGWYSSWSPPERWLPFFEPLLDAGYTVFRVRHGSSPRYSIPEAIDDVTQAVRFVRSNAGAYGVDPERLGVMGNSAGGHLALVLGTQPNDEAGTAEPSANTSARVAAVVAWVPPTDLTIAIWEAPESLPSYRQFPALDLAMEPAEASSPLFDVTPDDAPALVIMGGADELLPPSHGERIAEAFEREGVAHELIVVEGAGHDLGGEENAAMIMRKTLDWFDLHLTSAAEMPSAD